MKSHLPIVAVSLISICLFATSPAFAQESGSLQVTEAAICKDVVDRTPVDVGISFPASIGKLYCFTKISGAEGPTEITHIWYYGNAQRAKVSLPVNAASWRTYSSKKIRNTDIGQWFVDVLSPHGKVLETLQFKITP